MSASLSGSAADAACVAAGIERGIGIPHALGSVPAPPALSPSGCPTGLVHVDEGVCDSVDGAPTAPWQADAAAVCARKWLLGEAPALSRGTPLVMQVFDVAVVPAARADVPRGTDVSTTCVTERLVAATTHAEARVASALAQAAGPDRFKRACPPCRVVFFGRLPTGHTAAVAAHGFRPGFWMRAEDSRMSSRPDAVCRALERLMRVAQGTFTAACHTLKNMRQLGPGDIAGELDSEGRPQRVARRWLWVSGPEPDVISGVTRRLQRMGEGATLQVQLTRGGASQDVPIELAETRVAPAYQALLALRAHYEGFMEVTQFMVRGDAQREFHTDVECSVDMRHIRAWRDPASAPCAAYRALPPAFPALVAGFDIEARSARGGREGRDVFPDASRPEDSAFMTCVSFMWAHAAPPRPSAAALARCPNMARPGAIFLRLAFAATASVPAPVPGVVTLYARREADVLNAVRDCLAVLHRPQMLLGYYSSRFDIPYLCRRAQVVGARRFFYLSARIAAAGECGEQQLQGSMTQEYFAEAVARTAAPPPDKRERSAVFSRRGGTGAFAKMRAVCGLVCVDVWWWIKNRYAFERYDLNTACGKLLPPAAGASSDGGASKFDMPYNMLYAASEGSGEDAAKVLAYCARDADLVLLLADRVALAAELMQSCQIMAVNSHIFLMQAQGIRLFHQLLREARAHGYVINDVRSPPPSQYEGGRVEQPIRGLYRVPVALFDYASMYPNVMMLANLCCSTHLTQVQLAACPATRVDAAGSDAGTAPTLPTPCGHKRFLPSSPEAIAHAMGVSLEVAGQLRDLVLVPPPRAVAAALRIPEPVASALRVAAFHVGGGTYHMFAQGVQSVMRPLLTNLAAARSAAKKDMKGAKAAMQRHAALAAALAGPADAAVAAAWRVKAGEGVPFAAEVAAAWAGGADADAAAAARVAEETSRAALNTADARQKAIKVVMNSVYGGCAARQTSTFSCPELSHTTTAYGRHMIQRAQACALAEYDCAMVYGDTDSIMVTLPDRAYAGCDSYEARMRAAFAFAVPMEDRLTEVSGVTMELEAVAAVSLFTDVKKRYGMRFFETLKEFEADPWGGTLKLRGNEAVRRSTPAITRDLTRAVYRTLLARPDEGTVDEALRVVEERLRPLAQRSAPLEQLAYTMEIRGDYADTPLVPDAVSVAWALARKNPGFEPESGDRVQYVRVKTADATRLVPPPRIAAARYEMCVLGMEEPSDTSIQNAAHARRASATPSKEVDAADTGAPQRPCPRKRVQLPLAFGGAPGADVAASADACGAALSPAEAAVQAMQAAWARAHPSEQQRRARPFSYAAARKLWPKDSSGAAYCRGLDEVASPRREVDFPDLVQRAMNALAQPFDNAVPPGTPVTVVHSSNRSAAREGARQRYFKELTDLEKASLPKGTPLPARRLQQLCHAAYNQAKGQRTLLFASMFAGTASSRPPPPGTA